MASHADLPVLHIWPKTEQNLSLDPATCVFHYAFECFEGMKAYKDKLTPQQIEALVAYVRGFKKS